MNAGPADPLAAAQGLRCAGRTLGLAPGWARCIVERPRIARVPHAPRWLRGAMVHEGHVIPVIDLAAWIAPGAARPAEPPGRVLVGEAPAGRAALVLEDTPVALQAVPAAGDTPPDLPAALAGCLAGRAVDASGQDWPLLDVALLVQAWQRALDEAPPRVGGGAAATEHTA